MFKKQNQIIVCFFECIFIFLFSGANVYAYNYDPNDFAVEVVDYDDTGAGDYDDPYAALGRPSINITYFGALRPLAPVIQAEGYDQVVTVGWDGYLIVKFNHKVADDENNLYGIDFIVFGNAFEIIGDDISWSYEDPDNVIIRGDSMGNFVYPDPAVISVSQDGIVWYSFNNGPFADDFAPTLGRICDPNNPQGDYGSWDNQWWGDITDPTLPVDPNIKANDFSGQSVAYMAQIYGNSAGGTGFDLQQLAPEDYEALSIDPDTGRRWIQYVKIECKDPYNIEKPEIDAIADVSSCGDYKHPFPPGDINKDCFVDFLDFAIIASEDFTVDFAEISTVTSHWLECTWDCE